MEDLRPWRKDFYSRINELKDLDIRTSFRNLKKAECRHLNSHYRFEQLQLKPISILLSTKALYIWRERRESVDNATFYGKLYLAARAIAQRIDDRKFRLLKIYHWSIKFKKKISWTFSLVRSRPTSVCFFLTGPQHLKISKLSFESSTSPLHFFVLSTWVYICN